MVIMDSKSIWLWLFSVFNGHFLNATYSNVPIAEVSRVCSDKAWYPLAAVSVDSNHPTLRQNSHLSMKWKRYNFPRNLHLWYRLTIEQCKRLAESVQLCVLQGRTDDYRSWSYGQCWIQCHSQEFCQNQCILSTGGQHLSKWTSRLQCCHFLYIGLFVPYFCFFSDLYLNVFIVCNDCIAVLSFDVYFCEASLNVTSTVYDDIQNL